MDGVYCLRVICCNHTKNACPDFVARSVRAAGHDPGETYVMLRPGRYTLAVSVGEPDGRPVIALPLANGANRIYPLGPIEVRRVPR